MQTLAKIGNHLAGESDLEASWSEFSEGTWIELGGDGDADMEISLWLPKAD